ncbi:DMT family transporter [Pontivivens ytuae]|uniref:DMT family transporter n=1 Tax=Pontivivens ytuae TaxID=2789856 RepID=A0A7S9LQT6_9RHOB|nr:DMT family transporter [Pontivivens ytuae]QPH53290.1 DMT family transporter [Pontivivens ytuae]
MQQSPPGAALPHPARSHADNLRGLGWMLFSVASASAMSVGVRVVSLEIDSRMIVTLRAGLTTLILLVLLPLLWRRLRITSWRDHIVRGALIGVSTHLGFYTLAEIPLATATVLFFTAPIFATILAALFQNERVGPRRWAAVAAGFIGAAIILRPGFNALHPAMLAALASSLLFAIALSMSRRVATADGPFSAFVSSVVVTLVLSLPLAAPVWSLPHSTLGWSIMALVVATGAMRNIADIQAYRYAEAGLLAPVTYLRLVLIGLAGYVLFGEVIDSYTGVGATLIVVSTLYIAHRARVASKAGRPGA